jgi:signal transduction histidine kinase/CheY-like chemotaxis protein
VALPAQKWRPSGASPLNRAARQAAKHVMAEARYIEWIRTLARVIGGRADTPGRETAYQIQIYVIALLALVIAAVLYIPVGLVFGEPVGAMAIGVCTAGGLATVPLYFATRSVQIALQGMSAAIFTMTSFLTWHQGGLSSPLAPWLMVVPLALSIAGLSSRAYVWFGIVLVEMLVMGGLALAGHGFVKHRGVDPEVLYVLSLPGLFLVIFSLLFLVNRARLRASTQLHAQNEEFAVARDTALAAVREKSRFLANMSHEIRTPLNGVLGAADVLAATPLTAEQRGFVGVLRQSGNTLLALVNDVLDYSKIEAGRVTLEHMPFDLREVVESVAELFAPAAAEKGLVCTCRVAPDLPAIVTGDALRLRQILSNLLSNAVKFTANGEVAVEAVRADEGQGGLEFRVIDTGIGIDDTTRDRLFGAFVQADDTTTRVFGGTGLGLAISAELVRLMGSRIRVDSTPGAGSCFHFVVPMPLEAPARPQQAPAAPPVALVQAAPRVRAILAELLADSGRSAVMFDAVADLATAVRAGTAPTTWIVPAEAMLDPAWRDLARLSAGAPRLPWRILATAPAGAATEQSGPLAVDAVIPHPLRRSAVADALSGAATIDQPADPTSRGGPPLARRILLVEDNAVNRQIASTLLKRIGCEVEVAVDGAVAVERWRDGTYDLVLMDCQMPVMDGYDATRAIRSLESDLARPRTPVVALTANALAGDRELCLAAGMDDHLGKPFTVDLLRGMIERWAIGDRDAGSRAA